MFDKAGLAEEVSEAINRSETGEVRIRWTTTQGGQQVVEVVRSGTWSPDLQPALWVPSESGPTGPAQVGSEQTRSVRRSADVRKIVDLIERFGYDAVKLDTVRSLLGLAKTTAHHRLAEARDLWNEEKAG